MTDSWVINPAPKKSRRNKVIGAVVGFVAAASITAIALWIVIPNSPGFGYGKAEDAAQGLALSSVQLNAGDLAGFGELGPSDSGTIATKWLNPNAFPVTITELSVPAGSSIERVGDPTCVAGPSTFSVPGETNVNGIIPANNVPNGAIGMAITTNANFPSCLAGGVFKVPVLAKSVVNGT